MQTNILSLFAIKNANKSYGGFPVLVNASLDLKISQVHALVGENGAGKSTLIRIMAGVSQADSAQFFLRGVPAQINNPTDSIALGMRFIHQELNFIREVSVAENIFLGQPYPTIAGVLVDWNKLYERAGQVLLQIGIDHIDPKAQMAKLSTGDKMLVRIASAFIGDEGLFGERSSTSIYVMDEPTAALTGNEVDMLFNVIRHLRGQGYGILYVSHRMDEIFEIANQVTIMRNGQVVASEQISEVTHNDIIQHMTGREIDDVYPPRRHILSDKTLLSVNRLQTAAIEDISFELQEGEILGVVGLRDNGQTELLQALVGLKPIVSGGALIDGNPIPNSISQAWDTGIAFVPKERRSEGLVFGRSVRDNVVLPYLENLGFAKVFTDQKREKNLSQDMSDDVQLKAKNIEQRVRELSGGNQQKVMFARALANKPRLLLLDEPTRGVDVGAKYDIYNLIRDISDEGTGVIIASSDLPEIIGLCERVIVMQDGKISAIVKTHNLTEAELLRLCYGTKMKEIPSS